MNEEYDDDEKNKKSKNDKNRAPLSYRDTTDFHFLMQNFPYGFYLHTYTCTHTHKHRLRKRSNPPKFRWVLHNKSGEIHQVIDKDGDVLH